jgi:hypothetical protein
VKLPRLGSVPLLVTSSGFENGESLVDLGDVASPGVVCYFAPVGRRTGARGPITATSLTFLGATFFGLITSTVRRTHRPCGRGGGSRLTSGANRAESHMNVPSGCLSVQMARPRTAVRSCGATPEHRWPVSPSGELASRPGRPSRKPLRRGIRPACSSASGRAAVSVPRWNAQGQGLPRTR